MFDLTKQRVVVLRFNESKSHWLVARFAEPAEQTRSAPAPLDKLPKDIPKQVRFAIGDLD